MASTDSSIQSVYDGADLGEVLTTANQIIPGDFASYASSFSSLAYSVLDRAKSIAKAKFPVSARSAFFAAATYFRSADFYLHEDASDSRIYELWGNQTAAFDEGLALLTVPNQRVTIETAGFDIPGIWFTPDDEEKQRPTIIMVITLIVDWLLEKPKVVDPDSIGLLGFSFGGYLVPRSAAFEHRLAAIFAVDGVWDWPVVVNAALGTEFTAIHDLGDKEAFDEYTKRFLQPSVPTPLRWGLGHGMWAFNTESAYGFVTLSLDYRMEPVVDKVRTPVFIGDAQNDLFFKGQAAVLAEALGDWAYLHHFTEENGIGEHCGIGAFKQHNQVIFDWFQDLLDLKNIQ
ncbi:hypothetical protein CORC01_02651 [Colletotrichum orchidophilum]|uniref:AB hydrolase-1 domain-containing protein n=1 Tax=Colletotrichum orchidophilum TaxID=1209926 RepID=A0A1G4BKV4_9PEZI|nr:uncharacterized protein CORC01_02651 [Colletotrichum orchidophilum]OHF02072.1 hypothetical protein CORC01_02651 [Colletotrichum orchidophilum]